MTQTIQNKSGADKLRDIVKCLNNCREGAIDSYSPTKLINLVEACWASEWEVFPDQLPQDLRDLVAMNGPKPVILKNINSWCEENL